MVRLLVHIGWNIIWFSIRLVCYARQVQLQVKEICGKEVGADCDFQPKVAEALCEVFLIRSASLRVVPLWTIRPSSVYRPISFFLYRSSGRLARAYVTTSSHISVPSKLPIVTSKRSALFFFTHSLSSLKSSDFLACMMTLSSSSVISVDCLAKLSASLSIFSLIEG